MYYILIYMNLRCKNQIFLQAIFDFCTLKNLHLKVTMAVFSTVNNVYLNNNKKSTCIISCFELLIYLLHFYYLQRPSNMIYKYLYNALVVREHVHVLKITAITHFVTEPIEKQRMRDVSHISLC